MDTVSTDGKVGDFIMSGMNKGGTARRYKEFLYIKNNKMSALIENINRQLKKKRGNPKS